VCCLVLSGLCERGRPGCPALVDQPVTMLTPYRAATLFHVSA
jgi:hypothetical protein